MTTYNAWTITQIQGTSGWTDHSERRIWAPAGNGNLPQAIRMHELLHALSSQPQKPTEHTDAYTWIEEIRIQRMLEKYTPILANAMTLHRKEGIDRTLQFGKPDKRRQQAKTAILGEAYRLDELVTHVEDRETIKDLLDMVMPDTTHDTMQEYAEYIDMHFPPERKP